MGHQFQVVITASPEACDLFEDDLESSIRGQGSLDPSLPALLHDININFKKIRLKNDYIVSCASCLLRPGHKRQCEEAEPLLDRDPKNSKLALRLCPAALPQPVVWPWSSHLTSLDFSIYKKCKCWMMMVLYVPSRT